MQPFTASFLEFQRLGGGVVAEYGGLIHFTFVQAHAVAVFQVDCRVKDHSNVSKSGVEGLIPRLRPDLK